MLDNIIMTSPPTALNRPLQRYESEPAEKFSDQFQLDFFSWFITMKLYGLEEQGLKNSPHCWGISGISLTNNLLKETPPTPGTEIFI